MSKVSFSRELLGTIRFVFDKTKSRNLNATQAYDSSTSQIVLASYPATSTIKAPTNSLGGTSPDPGKVFNVTVGVTGTQYAGLFFRAQQEKAGLAASAPLKSITLDWTSYADLAAPVPTAKQTTGLILKDTAQFAGIICRSPIGIEPADPGTTKTKKTQEIFAGNITVGTGLYITWQGKYAVLKVDLLTDNAILRVYNE